MGDDNVPEVFIMMRYPASIGALGEIELDQMFCAIRQKDGLSDKVCTFEAFMTECDSKSCPMVPLQPSNPRSHVSSLVSKYENFQSSGIGSSEAYITQSHGGSLSMTMRGFYCKSAPPYTKSGNNPDLLQSTILVELYTRFIEVNDNTFVKTACESIAEVIQKHLVQRLSKLSVHFLISKPDKVFTYHYQD